MEFANILKNSKLTSEKDWVKHIENLKSKKQKLDFKKEFIKSIKKRIPKKKFGILFSGGIDSVLIAFICKLLNANFTCYVVGRKGSPDLIAAEETAKKYGFKLKKNILSYDDIENTIKTVVKIVGPDIMKVGVGSVMYEAIKLAKKDRINYLFSGLGSEEVFAGYDRHLNTKKINQECWKGLKAMYKRDFERDYSIGKALEINLLTPFLDSNVIISAMQIPGKEKIKKGYKKYALRKFAEDIGLKDAWRQKKAAQYGTYFDKALKKIAKKHGFDYKKFYLDSLINIGALISSGKDSIYALYLMLKKKYNVKCMITLKSENPDSYMFHTPTIDLVKLQADAINLPLFTGTTKGEKEKELKDLKSAIKKAKEKYKLDGIVTGALFSNYQRERIEKICDELGLRAFSPLWHMDQEQEMRSILKDGFKFVITKVAAEGFSKKWFKIIENKDVDELVKLNKKLGINIAGEGGEFETLMVNGPIFKEKIEIVDYAVDEESEINATLKIKKAKLVKK